MPRLKTWLVFENTAAPGTGAPASHFAAMGTRPDDRPPQQYMQGYQCVGAVNAEDEQAAAMAVMSVTRRISKFAVIEATIIDFQPGESQQAEGKRIELNP